MKIVVAYGIGHKVSEIWIVDEFMSLKVIDFSFYFSKLNLRENFQMYLKQLLSLFSTLTNCFMSPKLISNRAKMVLLDKH